LILQAADVTWTMPGSISINPPFSPGLDQAGVFFDQSILISLGPGRRLFLSIHPFHQAWARPASFSINLSSSGLDQAGIFFDQSILIRLGRRFRSIYPFHHKTQKLL